MAAPDFPAVRACIFDMDGLLINSEDIIGRATNQLLKKYGRPPLTQSMRARLMGVPNSNKSDMFHDWAQLPISRDQWAAEISEQMRRNFPDCEPLPGAEKLLLNLSRAQNASSGGRMELALATTTKSSSYELKMSKPATRALLDLIEPERRIRGDDPRLRQGRSKPAPDLYLIALDTINASVRETPILPKECLVFEDSVAGVEAARRAGMRVVWVPHPDLAIEYQAGQKDVLAGKTGMFDIGDEWQLGEVDDGWAETIPSLEKFDYLKYGIRVP
jgi:pseudouridine 5'-phosphatase